MPASGSLHVRVFTSAAQLPLSGATVIVIQLTSAGKYDLLSVQQTDSSGLIQPVIIPTPSMAQSCSPSAPGAPPPFALCDIWVEVSGYGIRQARDVQIFPGVETVQDFRLPPLEQGEADLTRRDSHTVPPHDL